MADPKPKKIAILGGGVSSLSTALALTEEADWQSRYDITVYQLGWRLGGKGASGRSGKVVHQDGRATIEGGARIEEHGLHIWLGFYENAFRMIQRVYAENEVSLPPAAPLRTWTDAFKRHSFICLEERLEGDIWRIWPLCFPEDTLLPGSGGPPCTVWDYIKLLLDRLASYWKDSSYAREAVDPTEQDHIKNALGPFATTLGHFWDDLSAVGVASATELVELAASFANSLHPDPNEHCAEHHAALIQTLDTFHRLLLKRVDDRNQTSAGDEAWRDETRRVFTVMDLGIAVIRGLVAEGVIFDPNEFDVLEEDLQVWLSRHGASDMSCRIGQSAVIRGLYDLVFAYIDGDTEQASFATGPALRSVLDMLLHYKGAIFWKMQAGMGDTIFSPIYMVLRKRGVNFQFFRRVENIGLSSDKKSVATIRMGRQVTMKQPNQEYDPIAWAKDIPCWPAEPDYTQIVEGDHLQAEGINLESFWTPWRNVETLTLEAGVDFDEVVLGISLGALPYLCPELIQAAPDTWGRMVRDVKTVRTMAFQFWVNQTIEELGWKERSPVMDAYEEPLNTWADMSQLLVRENWSGEQPKSVGYFCGQMVEGVAPQDAIAYVKDQAKKFVSGALLGIWPGLKAQQRTQPAQFLVRASAAPGETALESQYFRANVDPSERYVMSVAGSTSARLRADQSGFERLVLTGDWISNGFNAGCVEASVMSGLQAANVVAGRQLAHGVSSLRPSFGR